MSKGRVTKKTAREIAIELCRIRGEHPGEVLLTRYTNQVQLYFDIQLAVEAYSAKGKPIVQEEVA